jgi:hypothetical protein
MVDTESNQSGVMPPELVERIFNNAGDDVILVGGQALKFWMDVFDVRQPALLAVVTRDVDFFSPSPADTGSVVRFALAIRGKYAISKNHLSALVGMAYVELDDHSVANVDVLHTVIGIERDRLQQRAVEVEDKHGKSMRVMHPLDVLVSRNVNLHVLAEKQTPTGHQQLKLAIEVARCFLESRADGIPSAANRELLDTFRPVMELARGGAAKKNATRYGIHVADAYPAYRVPPDSCFWEKQWPYLRKAMSEDYADYCEDRRLVPRPSGS